VKPPVAKRLALAWICLAVGAFLLWRTDGAWIGALPGVPLLLACAYLNVRAVWEALEDERW
jgi:hypothetical protein